MKDARSTCIRVAQLSHMRPFDVAAAARGRQTHMLTHTHTHLAFPNVASFSFDFKMLDRVRYPKSLKKANKKRSSPKQQGHAGRAGRRTRNIPHLQQGSKISRAQQTNAKSRQRRGVSAGSRPSERCALSLSLSPVPCPTSPAEIRRSAAGARPPCLLMCIFVGVLGERNEQDNCTAARGAKPSVVCVCSFLAGATGRRCS